MNIMKRITFGVILVFGSLLLLGSQLGRGWAALSPSGTGGFLPAYAPWRMETVDSGNQWNFVNGVSLAFSGETNNPYVSYYDKDKADLRLAVRSGFGTKKCTPKSDWSCETVDAQGRVGKNSSLAIFNSKVLTKYGIAYYDETNHSVKVAIQTCLSFFGCNAWNFSTIEKLHDVDVKVQPSLVFDSSGKPRLSYQRDNSTYPHTDIKYARYVGSGGNCGLGDASGKWHCEGVAHYGTGVTDISLALTSGDQPVIAFLDKESGGGDTLQLCRINSSGMWFCQSIDDISHKSEHVSLALDKNNHARIAYASDGKNDTLNLRYAYYVGSGGNCGGASDYRCDTITNDIESVYGTLAMTLDKSERPVIAYLTKVYQIALARPLAAYQTLPGNCGPDNGFFHTWMCKHLDSDLVTGNAISVAVDKHGLIAVAFQINDSIGGLSDLMVARQYYPVYLPFVVK